MDAVTPVKKLSFNSTNSKAFQSDRSRNTNTELAETPRKPFALLSPANNLPLTPQIIHTIGAEDENKTPKAILSILTPKTPGTVSTPMKMANSPASFCVAYEEAPASITKAVEEMEYSFEEKRLTFYLRR